MGLAFRKALLAKLDPDRAGLTFQPIKQRALDASVGGTDFGRLFLGFSFFLIVAALMLVGLLIRLNLDRRAAEIGLLLASGYRPATVFRLLLAEGALLAVIGSIVGVVIALAYTVLLLKLLALLWPGGLLQSFLRPHYSASSLCIGVGSSLVVSWITVALASRNFARQPPRALLAGQTQPETVTDAGRALWSKRIAIVSMIGAIALLGVAPFLTDHEAKAGTFFGSGALLLTAMIAGISVWMRSGSRHPVETGGLALLRLGIRNAARYPTRSLLTIGLLASSAFLLIAVEAFRRHIDFNVLDKNAGSGGFNLLAESDLPVDLRLDTDDGRKQLLDKWEERLRGEIKAADPQPIVNERRREAEELLRELVIFPIRINAGDDASCLNLYQPTQPQILGITPALINRGGFQFAAKLEQNPWLTLLASQGSKADVIEKTMACLGENNTVVWMLHKGLGDTVDLNSPREGDASNTKLKIVGLLEDSVFQSSLLIAEADFLKLFPDSAGYRMFLIQAPSGSEAQVKALLQSALAEQGFEVTPTAQRLAEFQAVENTYLTTFQALGGLGLLLGTLGLAIVLLRSVWERRAELALLRALGYRSSTLSWLVLAENAWLLLLGIGAGMLAASLAILVTPKAHLVAWGRLLGLLGVVLLVGFLSVILAIRSTVRAPLIPALRRE